MIKDNLVFLFIHFIFTWTNCGHVDNFIIINCSLTILLFPKSAILLCFMHFYHNSSYTFSRSTCRGKLCTICIIKYYLYYVFLALGNFSIICIICDYLYAVNKWSTLLAIFELSVLYVITTFNTNVYFYIL